ENGSTTQAGKIPAQLDPAKVLWQAPLPGKGCSTPIVWDRRIYLTAPVGGQDALLSYDWTGKLLWQTKLGSETAGKHRNGSGSNPSPVTDGKGLFVTFKSGNLAALNFDGTIRWQANLVEKFGPVRLYWDYGTSPALTERNVVMARMHDGESWVAAFDKVTGEMRWKTARNYETPREGEQSYTTPLVIQHAGREAVLVWGAEHLTLHDAAGGEVIWSCGKFNPGAVPNWPNVATPVIANGVAVICFGRADRGQPLLFGVKLGGEGDVTATHRAWMRDDVGAFVPSPAAHTGRIYVLSDRGQVDCLEAASGKTVWSGALPRASSNYYASPLVAGGNLYAAREDGAVFVARVEGGFKLLAESKFDDRVIASIVPAADRLFIRGEANLYCLAAP
ncbi:MAG: PQQ-binding-like beta-propeller repeat protein, partial [Verrucomicrobia bacterium]|nr:PQQ-binding-like beta-propeller repeat protein [Verrucomicrobiota bacterium]